MDLIKEAIELINNPPIEDRLSRLNDLVIDFKNLLSQDKYSSFLNDANQYVIYELEEDEEDEDIYFSINTIYAHSSGFQSDTFTRSFYDLINDSNCLSEFQEGCFSMQVVKVNNNEDLITTRTVYDMSLRANVERAIGMAETFDYSFEEQKTHLQNIINELVKYPAFNTAVCPY